jgi:hypothetical protein
MNDVRIEPILIGAEKQFSAKKQSEAEKTALAPAKQELNSTSLEPPPLLMLPPPDDRANVRHMSPRQLAEFAHELYIEGTLNWDEFRLLGAHPELHPDYNATIGGLTGEAAQPDKPRDQVAYWQERLDFEMRHGPEDSQTVKRTARVLEVLRWQEVPKVSLSI